MRKKEKLNFILLTEDSCDIRKENIHRKITYLSSASSLRQKRRRQIPSLSRINEKQDEPNISNLIVFFFAEKNAKIVEY